LWVADTDFKVAPVIQRAIEDRMDHGVFGYTSTDDQCNQVVADYYQKKNKPAMSMPIGWFGCPA